MRRIEIIQIISALAGVAGLMLAIWSQKARRVVVCGHCRKALPGGGMNCPNCHRPLLETGVERPTVIHTNRRVLCVGLGLVLSAGRFVSTFEAAGIVLFAVVVGVPLIALFAKGANEPRVGVPVDHPACGQCGYNLTGLTVDRCPECGLTFRQAGVYRVRPRRSWGVWIVLGLIAMMVLLVVIS